MSIIGDVPEYPDAIDRREKQTFLRESLATLVAADGLPLRILILHGMAGSGKTCVASQVVRSLAEDYSNSGIMWKSTEYLRNLSGDDLAAEIHVLSASVRAGFLDSSDPQHEHSAQQGRKLLVLDGVWHADMLKVFEGVSIIILATTRNMAIGDGISALTRHVDVTECTSSEAIQIIEHRLLRLPSDLTDKILQKCNGLAQACVLAASLMKSRCDISEWKRLDSLYPLKRKDWLQGAVQAAGIGYLSFYDMLNASVEHLEEEHYQENDVRISGFVMSNLYLSLTTMHANEDLYGKKLTQLWHTDKTTAQNWLSWFADRSLLVRTSLRSETSNQEIFRIHPVQHTFLREYMKENEDENTSMINEKLRKWIERFLLKHELQVNAEIREHNLQLAHVIRTIRYGERWDQCFDSAKILIEKWEKLLKFQKDLLQVYVVRADKKHGWTVLHEAARRGERSVIRCLLQLKLPDLDINAETTEIIWFLKCNFFPGNTPLHVASATGDLDVVKELVSSGADMNAVTSVGWTPLHWANYLGHHSLVDYFKNYGTKKGAKEVQNGFSGKSEEMKALNGALNGSLNGIIKAIDGDTVVEALKKSSLEGKKLSCIVCRYTFSPMAMLTFTFNATSWSWEKRENLVGNEQLKPGLECVLVPFPSGAAFLVDTLRGKAYWTDDINTGNWERRDDPPTRRFGVAGVVHDQKIYLIGGSTKYDEAPTDIVECYDMNFKIWIQPNSPRLPTAVYRPAAVLHPTAKQLVVIGGQNANGEWTNSIQYLDENENWKIQEINFFEKCEESLTAVVRHEDVIIRLKNSFVALTKQDDTYALSPVKVSAAQWSESMAIWNDQIVLTSSGRVWILSGNEAFELPHLPFKEKTQTFVIASTNVHASNGTEIIV